MVIGEQQIKDNDLIKRKRVHGGCGSRKQGPTLHCKIYDQDEIKFGCVVYCSKYTS